MGIYLVRRVGLLVLGVERGGQIAQCGDLNCSFELDISPGDWRGDTPGSMQWVEEGRYKYRWLGGYISVYRVQFSGVLRSRGACEWSISDTQVYVYIIYNPRT